MSRKRGEPAGLALLCGRKRCSAILVRSSDVVNYCNGACGQWDCSAAFYRCILCSASGERARAAHVLARRGYNRRRRAAWVW